MNVLIFLVLAIAASIPLSYAFRAGLVRVLPHEKALVARDMPLTAAFGIMVIGVYVIVAFAAPLLAPFPERAVVGSQFQPWDSTYLLGTDRLGRDMLSRLIYGARNTVGIAFATTALAFVVGALLGIWAALRGGWLDQLLSRFVDALMAIPSLIFSLLLLTIFGTSVLTLILVIAAVDATRVYRIARSVSQGVVVMDYIEAARLRGEGNWYLIRHEILPNALAPLVAEFGLRFCFVFLTISSLSFLGLGIQPPTADWGSMVRDNATLITFGDMTPLMPAGAIALLTVAVNFVVDWQLYRASGLKEQG
ncbi:ABC transporter permease [Roseinatronobacter alkalisoli]|uniref:ABC transporter permease n=1 Tax=Roseinatronobacter alkalisoli TaxID=3028235 RepID=A0ABT5T8H3_9RHOB|nr:ABC transporter permease [Roseinatronobacter sp. HJB301]MDD7971379.1 ABC transporter permease [Roseinatronobacter sp. HJB301]